MNATKTTSEDAVVEERLKECNDKNGLSCMEHMVMILNGQKVQTEIDLKLRISIEVDLLNTIQI